MLFSLETREGANNSWHLHLFPLFALHFKPSLSFCPPWKQEKVQITAAIFVKVEPFLAS